MTFHDDSWESLVATLGEPDDVEKFQLACQPVKILAVCKALGMELKSKTRGALRLPYEASKGPKQ